MRPKLESDKAFYRLTFIVFLVLAGINYCPALFGKVPFPSDLVLQFPAWAKVPHPGVFKTYSDIGDLVTYFYPARAAIREAFRHGELAIWNPYFISGGAFAGAAQSALFYPLNLFFYFFPLPAAWTIAIFLKMALSGFFMSLFVRSSGATRFGAIFSGIAFAYCGFMTVWQGQPMCDAAMWLPFVAYAVERLYRDRSGRSVAFAGLGFAMPILAGHPEMAAHVTLAGGLFAGLSWLSSVDVRRRDFDFGYLLWIGAAGVLALGLASVQMIPTVEWLRQLYSPLGGTWPPLERHQVLGLVSRDIMRAQNSAGILIPSASTYLGMITLLAAPMGALHRQKRFILVLAGVTIAAFGAAYGVEPFLWLVRHTPVLSGLKNDRMTLIGSFGLAALAGFGISFLEEESREARRRRQIAIGILAVSLATCFLLVYRLQTSTQFNVEPLARPFFSLAMIFLGAAPLIGRLYGLRRVAFGYSACAVALFDLGSFAYGFTGFARANEVFPNSPVFDFLRTKVDPGRFRIAAVGQPYEANANLMYDLSSADGYETRIGEPQRIFLSDLTESTLDSVDFTAAGLIHYPDRRLDMLNVKYVVVEASDPGYKLLSEDRRFAEAYNDGHVAILENKRVLPRAFVVPASGARVLPDVDERLRVLKSTSFDPERTVLLSERLPKVEPALELNSGDAGNPVEMGESGFNHISLKARASQPSVLVLSQTFYPGWTATIDGQAVPVIPVDIALTGIPLPAGAHDVVFSFRPLSVRLGAALSIATLILIAGLGSIPRREPASASNWTAAVAIAAAAGLVIVFFFVFHKPQPQRQAPVERLSALPVAVSAAATSFRIGDGDAVSGSARFEAEASTQVFGLAMLSYGPGHSLKSGAVIPSTPPIAKGIFPFRTRNQFRTAVSIANANSTASIVTFTVNGGAPEAVTVPPNGAIATFLDERPFNVHAPEGAFRFEASPPVAVSVLWTFAGRDTPFLMAPVSVSSADAPVGESLHVPYVRTGPDWSAEVLLVNPGSRRLTGSQIWYSESGKPVGSFRYELAANAVAAAAGPHSDRAGADRIEIKPDPGLEAPAVTALLFLNGQQGLNLIAVQAVRAQAEFDGYAEASGEISTDVAIANPSSESVTVRLGMDISIPPGGFVTTPAGDSGLFRLTSKAPVAAAVLRSAIDGANRRWISAYSATQQAGNIFPRFVSNGDFRTRLVLFAPEKPVSGVLRFFSADGSPIKVPVLNE